MAEKNNSYKINGHVTLEKTQLIKQQRKVLPIKERQSK